MEERVHQGWSHGGGEAALTNARSRRPIQLGTYIFPSVFKHVLGSSRTDGWWMSGYLGCWWVYQNGPSTSRY